jgi:hypothetical protein
MRDMDIENACGSRLGYAVGSALNIENAAAPLLGLECGRKMMNRYGNCTGRMMKGEYNDGRY